MAKSSGKSGVGAGRKTNFASNKVVSQMTNQKPGTPYVNYAAGSGSRPQAGKYPIDSSNPSSSQRIRPTNKVEGTGYKG